VVAPRVAPVPPVLSCASLAAGDRSVFDWALAFCAWRFAGVRLRVELVGRGEAVESP